MLNKGPGFGFVVVGSDTIFFLLFLNELKYKQKMDKKKYKILNGVINLPNTCI